VSESAFVKSEVDQEYRIDVESSKISSKSLNKPKFKSVKVRSVQSESCDTISERVFVDFIQNKPDGSNDDEVYVRTYQVLHYYSRHFVLSSSGSFTWGRLSLASNLFFSASNVTI